MYLLVSNFDIAF